MIRLNPKVHITPLWDCGNDPPYDCAFLINELVAASDDADADALRGVDDVPLVDAFLCDQFRMYEFKLRNCAHGRSHDWTECPFSHPGEKARRRDPRGFLYSGTTCLDFRKGTCKNGDSCEFAHGVFECWLHPDSYRTQPCKDGLHSRRRVCFFAHTPKQLRAVSPRCTNSRESDFSGSPMRHAFDFFHTKAAGSFVSSPTSILLSPSISPSMDSPSMSPSRIGIGCSFNDLAASMRNVQIGKMKLNPGAAAAGFCSPRGPILWPGNYALPSYGVSAFEEWDNAASVEVLMERVESGRDLRARIYAKLSKGNSFERAAAGTADDPGLDIAWVSKLVN